MTASQPARRAVPAFVSLDAAPITTAPSAFAQRQRISADPSRCGVNEDERSLLDLGHVVQKKTRRHPLQHQRRGADVGEELGQADEKVGPHGAHRRVGAWRRAGIGDAIPAPDICDVRSDAFDNARRLHSQHSARSDQIETAPAAIDIDEVNPDRRLPDARFACSRLANPRPSRLQNLRPSIARQHDLDAVHTAAGAGCLGRRMHARRAVPFAPQKATHRGEARVDDVVPHKLREALPLGVRADRMTRAIPTSRRFRR